MKHFTKQGDALADRPDVVARGEHANNLPPVEDRMKPLLRSSRKAESPTNQNKESGQ